MTTGGPDAPAGPARQRRRGRAVRLAVVAVLLAAGAWFGWSWLHDRWTHVYVVDARIDASAVTLSSRIAGWIAEMPVDDGDRVRKGDGHLTLLKMKSSPQVEPQVLIIELRRIRPLLMM